MPTQNCLKSKRSCCSMLRLRRNLGSVLAPAKASWNRPEATMGDPQLRTTEDPLAHTHTPTPTHAHTHTHAHLYTHSCTHSRVHSPPTQCSTIGARQLHHITREIVISFVSHHLSHLLTPPPFPFHTRPPPHAGYERHEGLDHPQVLLGRSANRGRRVPSSTGHGMRLPRGMAEKTASCASPAV